MKRYPLEPVYVKAEEYGYCLTHRRIATHKFCRSWCDPTPCCDPTLGGITMPCDVTFNIPQTDNPIPQPTMTNKPNHHEVNPHYSANVLSAGSSGSFDEACHNFNVAIQASYAKLNARKADQYESELVPLSNKPGAPLIPQYKLPLTP